MKQTITSDHSMETAKREINDAFHETVQFLKSQRKNVPGVKHFQLSGPILKRKKAAVLASLPAVRSRYRSRYPELDVDQIWISHCCALGASSRDLDETAHLTLAMAIYMLDRLNQSGAKPEKLITVSCGQHTLEELNLPRVRDPMYGEDLICEMVRIIENRNRRKEDEGWFLNLESAKQNGPAGGGSAPEEERIRFQDLFDRIDPVYRNRAVSRFREQCENFLDVLFDCAASYQKQADYHFKQASQILERCQETRKELSQKISGSTQEQSSGATAQAVEQMQQTMESIQSLMARNLECVRDADHAGKMLDLAVREFHLSPATFSQDFADRIPQADLEKLQALEVADPYETCFAYLCLLESGSDLPWLSNLSNFVLQLAARKLPWTAFEGDWKENEDLLEFGEEEEEEEEESGEMESDAIYIPGEPLDWIRKEAKLYRLEYPDRILYDPMKPPVPDWSINLPQMVYGLTETLMPRTVHTFDGTVEDLVKMGVDPGLASGIELYLQLAWDSGYRKHAAVPAEDPELPKPQDSDPVPSEQQKQLQMEIRSLRRELHECEQEKKELRQEISRMTMQETEQLQELAALRELIYLQSNEHDYESDRKQWQQIELPYRNRLKIVVYGGHETWLKAIRPMLPDVVFIPRGQTPNENLIRSQDRIWIQGNALSHSDFYKIINTTRTNHIPVRYFGFASAQKCALQLAQDDLEADQ